MLGVNVESKTRGVDLDAVARLAASLGARFEGELDQLDTYFRVRRGRLKLREISHRTPGGRISLSAELIRYQRPDESGPRASSYERTEIGDVTRCRRQLEAEYGVRGRVRKRRELWTLDSTRIHLDRVASLGDFVELETVSAGAAGQDDRREHDRIASALGLDPSATVEGSYIDLLEPSSSMPSR